MSDPFKPTLTGKVRVGGIVSRAASWRQNGTLKAARKWWRSAATARATSPTRSWRRRSAVYPEGIDGWMVKLDAKPEGGLAFEPWFFIQWPRTHRPHQVRLEGGDCSSDSYCYP